MSADKAMRWRYFKQAYLLRVAWVLQYLGASTVIGGPMLTVNNLGYMRSLRVNGKARTVVMASRPARTNLELSRGRSGKVGTAGEVSGVWTAAAARRGGLGLF